MKITILLQALFLVVASSSCTNQPSSNPIPKDLAILNDNPSTESSIDSSLQLNFTSGVRSIFEDSKGQYWFGSAQEGVCVFDGKEFTYFAEKDGLPGNQIRTIQEDENGRIWLGTDRGITSFDGGIFTTHTTEDFHAKNKTSKSEWQKTPTDLWFHGGMGTGTYRYDGERLHYLAFPVPENIDDENPYLVTGIAKGKEGTIWFATYPGVIGYDGESFNLLTEKNLEVFSEGTQLHVRSIFEDSKGNLWIGNNGIGVSLYTDNTMINFTEQNGLSIKDKGVIGSLGRIFSIAEDHKGNIWFGSRDNGAWRYDGQVLTNYTAKDGLGRGLVWEIYKDKSNGLWFGVDNGKVYKFNGESFDKIY